MPSAYAPFQLWTIRSRCALSLVLNLAGFAIAKAVKRYHWRVFSEYDKRDTFYGDPLLNKAPTTAFSVWRRFYRFCVFFNERGALILVVVVGGDS